MSYMTYILPGILGMSYASTGLIAFPIMLSSYRENGFFEIYKSNSRQNFKDSFLFNNNSNNFDVFKHYWYYSFVIIF